MRTTSACMSEIHSLDRIVSDLFQGVGPVARDQADGAASDLAPRSRKACVSLHSSRCGTFIGTIGEVFGYLDLMS